MPLKLAPVLRVCSVAGALILAHAYAADEKSLIGATRDQVIARFGQPKSHMVAGEREVLLFSGERIVLRRDIVVEADEVPIEPPPPPPAPVVPTTPAPEVSATTNASTPQNAPAGQAVPSKPMTGDQAAAPATEPASKATAPAAPIAPPQPEVKIIAVRPPSKSGTTPAAAAVSTPAAPRPTTAAPVVPPPAAPPVLPSSAQPTAKTSAPAVVPPDVKSVETQPPPPSVTKPAAAASAPSPAATPSLESVAPAAVSSPTAAPASTETPSTVAPAPTTATDSAKPAVAAKPKGKAKRAKQPTDETEGPDVTETIFTGWTYLISAIIIVGGIGYLVWRRRERNLALSASSVSATPFAPEQAPVAPVTRFTAELLNKLEWKRFEELVAAYYNKTGVVAARTKSGPASPVHIRISWKGEPRPFACVQCISHPTGLVEVKPIQALVDAIAAEDIRRGYVVTPGKFGVPARDMAEEKHITLLSGDIFLEKLNALPEPARLELMRDATAGDYMTPTCPQCEVKMTRAPADPSVWQCPQCGTVLPKM